jgi:DNA-binding GntR family transcriptional regulator
MALAAKTLLRDEIRALVMDRIVRGDLPAGAPIRAVDLSAELGVSPTPTREALTQLEREGFVFTEPNRGFFVKPLDRQEAQDVYEVLSELECLAIRLQGPLAQDQFDALVTLNEEMTRSLGDPRQLIGIDERWHRTLTARSGNTVLAELLTQLSLRVTRYEYAWMQASGQVPDSTEDHAAIASLLREGAIRKAASALKQHWRRSTEFINTWSG